MVTQVAILTQRLPGNQLQQTATTIQTLLILGSTTYNSPENNFARTMNTEEGVMSQFFPIFSYFSSIFYELQLLFDTQPYISPLAYNVTLIVTSRSRYSSRLTSEPGPAYVLAITPRPGSHNRYDSLRVTTLVTNQSRAWLGLVTTSCAVLPRC